MCKLCVTAMCRGMCVLCVVNLRPRAHLASKHICWSGFLGTGPWTMSGSPLWFLVSPVVCTFSWHIAQVHCGGNGLPALLLFSLMIVAMVLILIARFLCLQNTTQS